MAPGPFVELAVKLLGGATVVASGVVLIFKILGEKWLDRRLETHKAALGAHTELLKHDLQREMLKADIATNRVHDVYSQLWDKLLRAQGAVSSLVGLGFGTDYFALPPEDLAKVVADAPVSEGQRNRINSSLATDKRAGIAELQTSLRDVEIQKARLRVVRTKNYASLKSLYLSPPVREKVGEFITTLWGAWVEIHMNSMPANPNRSNPTGALKASSAKLQELELMMSAELHPGGKHAGIAAAVATVGHAPLALPGATN